jgi:hypothetical protein
MKSLRITIMGGIVALIVPGLSLAAAAKDGNSNQNFRQEDSPDKWRHHHERRDPHQRPEKHRYRYDVRHDNRGHDNKPEIRQDFKDIRSARKEVQQDRRELRGDYQELRKDRAELRRDIRNEASKEEIFKDRQEIRDDFKEIAKDRREAQKDQARLQSARSELKQDLRKK